MDEYSVMRDVEGCSGDHGHRDGRENYLCVGGVSATALIAKCRRYPEILMHLRRFHIEIDADVFRLYCRDYENCII